jgi:hypothetical protein
MCWLVRRFYVAVAALSFCAGLLIQLPDFLWQSVNIFAAAEQPLLRLPLCAALRLIKALLRVFTQVDCSSALGIAWSWAADMLQQLLNCAVAAGLMRALPQGTTAKAFQLFKDGSSIAGDSSNSGSIGGSSSSRKRYAEAMSRDIISSATSLLSFAESSIQDRKACTAAEREELQEICHHFTHQPVVAEVALQLLASRCVLLHQELQAVQRQQQQFQLSPQLGKRMRGDLLLLSDPRPRLVRVLPADAFLRADAAVVQNDSSICYVSMSCIDEMSDIALLLHLQLLALQVHGRSGNSSLAASRLTLSAPALQVTAELLLLAAVHWQQLYNDLSAEEQQLLKLPAAELTPAEVEMLWDARDGPLASAQLLLVYTAKLLQLQVQLLWEGDQWQPQLQLLQQGGGEVLLQGLSLVVHCSSLDSELREVEWNGTSRTLSAVMTMLAEPVTGEYANHTYKPLFIPDCQQQPRQHAVIFSRATVTSHMHSRQRTFTAQLFDYAGVVAS